MENSAIPLLNCVILGAFMVFAMRELSKTTTQAIKIKDEQDSQ